MNLNKKIILTSSLLLAAFSFTACGNAKDDYKSIADSTKKQQESLDNWAKSTIKSGTFDQKVEVLTEYSNLNQFKSELAAQLSAQLREEVQVEIKKDDKEKAYEMAKKIFKGMALQENIGLLAETANAYSKEALAKKDYLKAIDSSFQVLQLRWDEGAMEVKLAAEYELLKINLEANNIKEAQKYYDDIMDVTSLKGNENLAKKFREDTKKYSDKFPTSKFK